MAPHPYVHVLRTLSSYDVQILPFQNGLIFGKQKLTWKKVLIGSHNAALIFVPIMVVVWKDWKEEAHHQRIPDTNYEFIMDHIMIFALIIFVFLDYLEVVLEILSNLWFILYLKSWPFLGPTQEFIGVDVKKKGNASE